MKALFTTLLTILMLASCTERGAMLSSAQREADSLAMKVAVVPVMDCLPLYYAQRAGLFDSLGVDVRLLPFASMMDADTALMLGHAQVGYTALPRIRQMAERNSVVLLPLVECWGQYSLMVAPESKIKQVKQLDEKLVALARNNMSDWWLDQLLSQRSLSLDTLFRPQFNDVALRQNMLVNKLVDAALLPQPYARMARLQGCRGLATMPDTLRSMNVFATHPWAAADTLRQEQQRQLLHAMDLATAQLNEAPDSALVRAILVEEMHVPAALVDSVSLPRFPQLLAPQSALIDEANAWLEARKLKP